MTATSKLNKTQLQFTDTLTNDGIFSFDNDTFALNKGVSIDGATSGKITVKAGDTTTDYDIKLPSTQGATDTILTNDGNGNLSWELGTSANTGSLLKFALQGCLLNLTVGTTLIIPFSSVVGTTSANYNKVNLVKYDPDNILTNNVFTIPSSGWYQINIYIHHTAYNIDTTGAQNGLGDTSFEIRFNNSVRTEYMNAMDSEAGPSETACYSAVVNFNANDTFDVIQRCTVAQTNEDYIIKVGIFKLNTSTSTDGASDFTGATSTADGTSGLVPKPVLGQQNYLLFGSGGWSKPNAEAIFDLYGTERVYWDKKTSPTGVQINGSSTYVVQSNNNYLTLVNANSQTGRMYFTDGNNYKNYKLEVWIAFNTGTGPADYYWLWGEGTMTNTGTQGDTQGLVVATDTYNSNTHEQANSIEIYNGSTYDILKSKTTGIGNMGINPFLNNTYNKFVLMRYGDEITYYIEGHENTLGYYRDRVSSTQNLSGTTYGIGASTGGENMIVYVNSFKLTTLD